MSQAIEQPTLLWTEQEQPAERHGQGWVYFFIILQTVCALGIILPGFGIYRVFFRSAAYIITLAFLVFLKRKVPGHHPSAPLLLAVVGVLTLSYFHPDTQALPGVAQLVLYVAVASPIVWVTRLNLTLTHFRNVITLFWAFSSLGAFVGLLQVYYPDTFTPDVTVVYSGRGVEEALGVVLASGERVLRPMGLSDVPGGAGFAGYYAVVFAIGLILSDAGKWTKRLALASIPIGLFIIYMSMVRSVLVISVISQVVLAFCLLRQGKIKLLNKVLLIVGVMTLVGLSTAFTTGGDTIYLRVMSLFEQSPVEVYNVNRGSFVRRTFLEYLPQYPFGAGAGRWGMMHYYFGPKGLYDRSMWAEINWTGWVYDGGIFLIAANVAMLSAAMWFAWSLARDRNRGNIAIWAAIVFAYNMGILAMTFVGNPFVAGVGMDFWLLNGALFAAHRYDLATQPSINADQRGAT